MSSRFAPVDPTLLAGVPAAPGWSPYRPTGWPTDWPPQGPPHGPPYWPPSEDDPRADPALALAGLQAPPRRDGLPAPLPQRDPAGGAPGTLPPLHFLLANPYLRRPR